MAAAARAAGRGRPSTVYTHVPRPQQQAAEPGRRQAPAANGPDAPDARRSRGAALPDAAARWPARRPTAGAPRRRPARWRSTGAGRRRGQPGRGGRRRGRGRAGREQTPARRAARRREGRRPGRDFASYLAQGDRLRMRERPDSALFAYARAQELEPTRPEPHVGRGLALLDQGRLVPAERSFQQALRLDPRSGPALMGLAETYRAQGAEGGRPALLRAVPRGDADRARRPRRAQRPRATEEGLGLKHPDSGGRDTCRTWTSRRRSKTSTSRARTSRRSASWRCSSRERRRRSSAPSCAQLHHMKCPRCGLDLHSLAQGDVEVDTCFHCHGMWLDAGELEKLLARGAPAARLGDEGRAQHLQEVR